jgi:hypothetical protein
MAGPRRDGVAIERGKVKFTTEHFEQARRVARQWRRDGYSHVVVVRAGERARRCFPCRQRDVPRLALASWDYYPIPTRERLDASAPTEQTASRAEMWIAATIAYGFRYSSAPLN